MHYFSVKQGLLMIPNRKANFPGNVDQWFYRRFQTNHLTAIEGSSSKNNHQSVSKVVLKTQTTLDTSARRVIDAASPCWLGSLHIPPCLIWVIKFQSIQPTLFQDTKQKILVLHPGLEKAFAESEVKGSFYLSTQLYIAMF